MSRFATPNAGPVYPVLFSIQKSHTRVKKKKKKWVDSSVILHRKQYYVVSLTVRLD